LLKIGKFVFVVFWKGRLDGMNWTTGKVYGKCNEKFKKKITGKNDT